MKRLVKISQFSEQYLLDKNLPPDIVQDLIYIESYCRMQGWLIDKWIKKYPEDYQKIKDIAHKQDNIERIELYNSNPRYYDDKRKKLFKLIDIADSKGLLQKPQYRTARLFYNAYKDNKAIIKQSQDKDIQKALYNLFPPKDNQMSMFNDADMKLIEQQMEVFNTSQDY